MKRLQNKVVIVTGAGGGLGEGIAKVVAAEGAKVVIAELREEAGARVASQIRKRGGKALAVRCDVSRDADIQNTVKQAVKTFGRVDGLVNNAGINFIKDTLKVTPAEWDRVIGVDLRGAFFFTQAVMRQMLRQKPRGGSIVNISSVHSFACFPAMAVYDAAKWGVVGITKAIAVEYATKGIRLNAISPGLINTQIWADFLDAVDSKKKCWEYWKANIPMGRVIEPEEIARLCVFLLSDESSCMTGANIFADGGLTSQFASKPNYKIKPMEGRRS
jgi:NAD(P)-dependent dehydrogenase (short-subunit alcohol dehydrogenase family)